jgi:tRNA pseudouridine55 synthase
VARTIEGILVVDKPRGPTSHDVVKRLRKALGTREIGHAGTLDPMATGVLVVALGEGTKLVPYLTAADKSYDATVRLGLATDTLDADGRETASAPVAPEVLAWLAAGSPGAPPERVARALEAEAARATQVPPEYSAVKRGGVRAHEAARRGEAPVLAPRPVCVRGIAITGVGADPYPFVALRLTVTKGYYVRSLARDLAAALGTAGHLTSLRRTRSGAFAIDEAIAPDAPREALDEHVVPLAGAAARALPSVTLGADAAEHARHGRPVPAGALAAAGAGPHAWLAADGALVAVGERGPDGSGRVLRGFRRRDG